MHDLDGKIIQFQVAPNKDGDGETTYVLTDDGHLYYFNNAAKTGTWVVMY